MKNIKKISGLIWMGLAVVSTGLLLNQASVELAKSPQLDIKIFWFIIIPVFLPILSGFGLFGWYAWNGVYDQG